MNKMNNDEDRRFATSTASRRLARAVSRHAALALALLAIPHAGHAQGIVRGAQEGAHEGNRAPVRWAAWLAARSAPVSAARWAPSRASSGFPIGGHYRCRGYYNRYGHFHCYR